MTPSFPELVGAAERLRRRGHSRRRDRGLARQRRGRARLPFAEIQKRLGRKQVSQKLIAEVPVAYVVFDVIYADGELTLDKPLSERAQILDRVFAGAKRVAPRPVVNAQGSLMFEPEIDRGGAIGMGAARAVASAPNRPSNWRATSSGHGARQ